MLIWLFQLQSLDLVLAKLHYEQRLEPNPSFSKRFWGFRVLIRDLFGQEDYGLDFVLLRKIWGLKYVVGFNYCNYQ